MFSLLQPQGRIENAMVRHILRKRSFQATIHFAPQHHANMPQAIS